jgi:hypothetical protein
LRVRDEVLAMTEEQWEQSRSSQRLLEFMLAAGRVQRTKTGKRKLRLFSTACCRLIWELLPEDHRKLVELAEVDPIRWARIGRFFVNAPALGPAVAGW